MPLPMQAVQSFLQRNPAYLQGRNPQQVMAMLMAGDALPMETPPVTVSPGSPAPVQPGVQIDAPAPVADYRNQEALAQNITPAEDIIRRARESAAQRVQQAEAGAEVPAEIAEVLRRREARAEGDLEASEKERKQAMWLAVAMAGAKMASSQSPYFMAALAEGLDAGLQGFSKAKAEAAERKASILDRQEQAVLDRYQALEAAKERALAKMQAGERLAADEMTLINATEQELHDRAMRPLAKKKAEEELETAPLRRKLLEAQIDETKASAIYRRAAAAGGGGGGGGGGGSPDGGSGKVPYQNIVAAQGLQKSAEQLRTRANSVSDDAQKATLYAQADQLDRQARALLLPKGTTKDDPIEWSMETRASIRPGQYFRRDGKIYTQTPGAGYGGAATPGPAAARAAATPPASAGKADFQYIPGRGMVPVN